MADDIAKGIIDRFRSLPIARSAVLTGRTFSDVIYNAGILIVLMADRSSSIGWRVHTGIGSLIAGLRAAAAVRLRDVLARRLARAVRADRRGRPAGDLHGALPDHVHLERRSSRSPSLPSFLQPIAEWNPTSTLTDSLRQLWGNPNPSGGTSFPSDGAVLVTLVWVVVLIAIFGPLGVRRYRSMSR